MGNIIYSRHSRRRMKLYAITEQDIEAACMHGDKKGLPDGRIELLWDSGERFRYPLKVVGIETIGGFLIITAYPLKGTKKGDEL
jgi:hypothetical protein